VRPPEDVETRARVDNLRRRVAELKARFDAGRWSEVMKAASPLVVSVRAIKYEPLLAESLALLGNVFLKLNRSQNAEDALIEAYMWADSSRHDEVRAEVAANLVFVLGFQEGRFVEARHWAKSAEAVLRRMGGHQLLRAWLLNDLGTVYFTEGSKEEAVRVMRESLSLKQRVLGPDHPDVGVSAGNLAIAQVELGQHEEALEHIEQSVRLLERGLGGEHPELAVQLANHGEIMNAVGRHVEARQSFERARAIWERELGPADRSMADALTGIGTSYLGEGKPADALSPLETALRIRSAKEVNPAKRAETDFALARALWESNVDRSRARELLGLARDRYAKADAKPKVAEIDRWRRDRLVN
jgi:eukaryotic-like serine/threonine-protein kinase